MAACSCCWLWSADAEAVGAIELANAVPRITGNSEDTTEAGTPPEVRAPATDEVSSGGLSRLCVGVGGVVASTELRVLVRFGMDKVVDGLDVAAVGGDSDVIVEMETPLDPELGVYVAELDGIAVDAMVGVLPNVPG